MPVPLFTNCREGILGKTIGLHFIVDANCASPRATKATRSRCNLCITRCIMSKISGVHFVGRTLCRKRLLLYERREKVAGEEVQSSLAQQVQQQTQQLWQQLQEQLLKSAQDFYGNSLRSLDSKLEDDRSQLQDLLEQLPDSQEDMRARIEQLVTSYEAIEESIDKAAQRQRGVEEEVSQAVQQAQETVGQAAQPAQEVAGQATEQAQGLAGQATETAGKEVNTTKAAKRKAEELGVDLSKIAGSGPDGRITLKDVKSVAQR
jgi:pyruvate/2-oxoglutarate dehydrogenase complex dihydrolipoamide acyltransferase (E2) component